MSAKQVYRRLERKWRDTQLTVHKEAYRQQCGSVNAQIENIKKNYYSDQIRNMKGDQKVLFKLTNKLSNINPNPVYPTHSSMEALCNQFADFYTSTIDSIVHELSRARPSSSPELKHVCIETSPHAYIISTNNNARGGEAHQEVAVEVCSSDPIPTWLLKECCPEIVPFFTHLVNTSLTEAKMPTIWKTALVNPLLKNPSLDTEQLNNF
jgi:hypothetical protein